MAVFLGTGFSETITPTFVSATVRRIPARSFPGAGDDVILGQGGNDTIDGGAGNDVIDGGDGNDFLRGNLGADILLGGDGLDTASYTESATGVSVNLNTGLGFNGSAAGDQLFEIENLNGSSLADTLVGNALTNVLTGFGGQDFLSGLSGNDSLSGGDGTDSMNGGDGNDSMSGGTGNDLMNGGDGNDSMSGGDGNDPMSGGDGNDSLSGGDGTDTMSGGAGNDTMNGGLGNDLLIGGSGRDIMTGGGGLDTYDFNSTGESPPGVLTRDFITDFVGNGILPGDVIDVSTIDANVLLLGNQVFTFIGAAAFSAPGQLRYASGLLQGSTDLDVAAEFEVVLSGAPALTAFDILE